MGLYSNRSHRTSKCGRTFLVLTTFSHHLWSFTEQKHGNTGSICQKTQDPDITRWDRLIPVENRCFLCFIHTTLQLATFLNPFHPSISVRNHHTVLHTFPKVLTGRTFNSQDILFRYSCDLNVWFVADIIRRDQRLVPVRGQKGLSCWLFNLNMATFPLKTIYNMPFHIESGVFPQFTRLGIKRRSRGRCGNSAGW